MNRNNQANFEQFVGPTWDMDSSVWILVLNLYKMPIYLLQYTHFGYFNPHYTKLDVFHAL